MMNKALLEYEMKRHKVSIAAMCEKLGMSRSAFYRKCNGISEFTQSEIQLIVDLLDLESPMGIFFESKVS
jgi:ACT domain-containing protein